MARWHRFLVRGASVGLLMLALPPTDARSEETACDTHYRSILKTLRAEPSLDVLVHAGRLTAENRTLKQDCLSWLEPRLSTLILVLNDETRDLPERRRWVDAILHHHSAASDHAMLAARLGAPAPTPGAVDELFTKGSDLPERLELAVQAEAQLELCEDSAGVQAWMRAQSADQQRLLLATATRAWWTGNPSDEASLMDACARQNHLGLFCPKFRGTSSGDAAALEYTKILDEAPHTSRLFLAGRPVSDRRMMRAVESMLEGRPLQEILAGDNLDNDLNLLHAHRQRHPKPVSLAVYLTQLWNERLSEQLGLNSLQVQSAKEVYPRSTPIRLGPGCTLLP